jgi:ribosome biogenesis GTPase
MREGLLIKAYGGFYYVRAEGRTWELTARGRLRRDPSAEALASDSSFSLDPEPSSQTAAPGPVERERIATPIIKGMRPQAGARRSQTGVRPQAGTAPGFTGAPVVGDRVMFMPMEDGSGTLESILPRSNLSRPRVANVDQVLLVVPLAHPDPDLVLTDRMLICCQSERLRTLICFNKLDLVSREQADLLLSTYGEAGYQVFAASALQSGGLDTLRQVIDGKVSVLAGPSGAGKSTIINALDPGFAQSTGEISRKLGRGRHTTTYVELLPVAGGFIADTPGFSNLDLPPLGRADLAGYFPEIGNLAGECRFLNCLHHNEPDCAVKQALDRGLIVPSRYRNYLSFLAEVLVRERTY